MPYLYRCDRCNGEEEIRDAFSMNKEGSCIDCGMDCCFEVCLDECGECGKLICNDCVHGDLCNDCVSIDNDKTDE